MADKELKDNIEKIKEFLQSNSYEAGFELLITLNDMELTKALNDEIIIALEKESQMCLAFRPHIMRYLDKGGSRQQ